MELTRRYEQIEAAEDLLEDYCLLAAERRAQMTWLAIVIERAERHLTSMDSFDKETAVYAVLRLFLADRAQVEQQLVTYRHCIADLRLRLDRLTRHSGT